MQLIFKRGEFYGEGHLFLAEGEPNSVNFRILAETEFQDLSEDSLEALEFFMEEANVRLK